MPSTFGSPPAGAWAIADREKSTSNVTTAHTIRMAQFFINFPPLIVSTFVLPDPPNPYRRVSAAVLRNLAWPRIEPAALLRARRSSSEVAGRYPIAADKYSYER